MKNIRFKNLDPSLVNSLVLYQKKFLNELNGNIFFEKEIIRNMKNKSFHTDLCLENNSIKGFLLAQKKTDFFEVYSLFVSPDLRRVGIAMTLLSNLIDRCKKEKIGKIFLEVMEFNKAAKNLYLKNNFKTYGKRDDYYKSQDKVFAAMLMKLELK